MKNIINPTIEAMRIEGKPYEGVLFAGLMLTDEGVKLIEYNCRFGDPEIQSLVMRLDEDLGEILYQTAKGKLPKNIKFKSDAAVCVVMAAKGYPEKYSKGSRIFISEQSKNVFIFHAGTMRNGDKLLSCGGRVLGVTALGENIKQAQSNVYKAVKSIKWNDGFYRSDIAYRAINTSNKY